MIGNNSLTRVQREAVDLWVKQVGMEKGIILFNGLHCPLEVTDKAIAWAKLRRAHLLAIFLRSGRDRSVGYGYPSDLNKAECITDEKDAEANDVAIIESNTRLVNDAATAKHIVLHNEILVNPSEQQLNQILADAACIFTDEQLFEPGPMKITGINLRKLLKELGVPVELFAAHL